MASSRSLSRGHFSGMKIKITHLAWLLFPMALLAWAAVGLFAWTIQSDEIDRALQVQTTQESEDREATAIRIHSIARDTVEERTQLDKIFRTDVVSIVDLIETTGTAAGVKVTVRNVIPESAPPTQAAASAGIVATGFVIEAQGKFSTLMHVLQLFETLPIPSTLGRLDIEYVPDSGGSGLSSAWRLNAYIRVLTTSDVSS